MVRGDDGSVVWDRPSDSGIRPKRGSLPGRRKHWYDELTATTGGHNTDWAASFSPRSPNPPYLRLKVETRILEKRGLPPFMAFSRGGSSYRPTTARRSSVSGSSSVLHKKPSPCMVLHSCAALCLIQVPRIGLKAQSRGPAPRSGVNWDTLNLSITSDGLFIPIRVWDPVFQSAFILAAENQV
jgi:hypothetical protein